MDYFKNKTKEMAAIIRLHPYYSIGLAVFIAVIIFHEGSRVLYETPLPTNSDWAYTLRWELFLISGDERKLIDAYMNRHAYGYSGGQHYILPPGLTIGEAIKKEKRYLIKQRVAALQAKAAQIKASRVAALRVRKEERNQKTIDSMVSLSLREVAIKVITGDETLAYIYADNDSKTQISSIREFISFYNSSNSILFTEYIDIEAKIPPGKSFIGIFYPCGASSIAYTSTCQYFNATTTNSWELKNIGITSVKTGAINGVYSSDLSHWNGPSVLITPTSNANIKNSLNQASNTPQSLNQSESSQVNDWNQAAQNYGEIERLRDGQ